MKLPQTPPRLDKVAPEVLGRAFAAAAQLEPGDRYFHWDDLRRRKPPQGLTSAEWWLGIHFRREPLLRSFGLLDVSGEPFCFAATDSVQQLVHHIDSNASGTISAPAEITNMATQKQYLVRSLIEEALTSSQLEGAVATREQAKQMVRDGRKPTTKDETMVLNNYTAMAYIRENKSRPLTPSAVKILHEIITKDTLENKEQEGRLRHASDDIKVFSSDGTVVHVPPDAAQLNKRIKLMCDFANGAGKGFIHPVVRAVLLHFWLGYDHPFCDGNGRTARALFYWCMLNQGYWLTEYISISRVLRQAPVKYTKAFLHSETPPFDATHFLLHQLGVINTSIADLHAYIKNKSAELGSVERCLHGDKNFNARQISLLSHALRNPGANYTASSHKVSQRVSHQTATDDLNRLVQAGLLQKTKRGHQFQYSPAPDLSRQLAAKT